ncbi:cobalt/nickel transport system ATP-binding protein [Anoxybacillus tengchongensis]|uniref:Cobalt/nickel transport system ATP-binding protein n=1 Tax=Anoxybacillus tengchongensis TaxID=576944 RepID=A0A7X0DAN2_9BACL|nr:ABC transporter ATP-binding protein [Anoxybacillus tengchongensis]MBB6177710.1 cobalt/nickel transport system ATP-binding protein [Anoxybacillus tengchongensis]
MISVSNVFYVYPDGHEAIRDLSFSVQKGESIGIIGANGAGKSTLLKLLVGLYTPQSGCIVIDNMRMSKQTLRHIRQIVGFTFQQADDQLFMPTVYDDVAFALRNDGINENEVNQRVANALTIVGAMHLKDRPPYRLSEGEKRLVTIATVLAMKPKILLMDEPTAALDPKARRTLIHLVQELPHTKIVTTHDLDFVLECCERTIVLANGTIVYDGPTENVLTNEPFLHEHHLELPLMLQKKK